jgi:hypothetical protein
MSVLLQKKIPPGPESLVSRRKTGQLEKTNSSRQVRLQLELKERLWPEAAPNKEAKAAASGRVEMLPNQNKNCGAWRSRAVKSGAPRAGDSTSQMAQGPPKRGSRPSLANGFDYVQDLLIWTADLDSWLSFVKQLPRTRPIHEELIMRRLRALTLIDNVSERAEDVSSAFLFLVDVARQGFTTKHATGLKYIAIALSKHKVLEEAMFYPGSPLLESIRGLMQAAVSNALFYTDSKEFIKIAIAQITLQLPCTEFWKTLIEKRMLRFHKEVVLDLALARMCLSFQGLMPPPSNAEWHAMLSATPKNLSKKGKLVVRGDKIASWLFAISKAVQRGYPASAPNSPCEKLQKLTVEILIQQLAHPITLRSASLRKIVFAADILNVRMKPADSDKLMAVICRAYSKVQAQEAGEPADSFSRQSLPNRTEVGAALSSTLLHTLPVMPPHRVCVLLAPFMMRGHRIWLKEDTWAALLRALCRVAPEWSSRDVSSALRGLGVLANSSGWSLDEQAIDAVLAAVVRTAHAIHPAYLADTTRAFGSIPLPFDSPAGKALLARLVEGLEDVDEAWLIHEEGASRATREGNNQTP